LVGSIGFFFSNRKYIHNLYKEFFGYEASPTEGDDRGVEEVAEVSEKDSTARFYFTLLYRLAKEDITKIDEVEASPLYLCLNVASIMKEEAEKQREEYDKMTKKIKSANG
jgi:hypothetical protein